MAIDLTDANYVETIESTEGVSVVQFTASWCGPCRMLAPRLESLAESEGFTYYKVDIDENSELAREFRIMSIPTVKYYKNGNEFDKTVGVLSDEQIRTVLAGA